jgi:glucan 1,4-alpha-glucosidase
MAANFPENYEKHLDTFQLVKDVEIDWDESIYLEVEPSEYLTIARKEKGTDKWFVGNVNGCNTRISENNFDFLDKGKTHIAMAYADTKDTHYKTIAGVYEIRKGTVKQGTKLKQQLAPGGGYAISIVPAEEDESEGMKRLK